MRAGEQALVAFRGLCGCDGGSCLVVSPRSEFSRRSFAEALSVRRRSLWLFAASCARGGRRALNMPEVMLTASCLVVDCSLLNRVGAMTARLLGLMFASALLSACGGSGSTEPVAQPVDVCATAVSTATRQAGWQADIDCVLSRVAQNHPNPSERGDYSGFKTAMAKLAAEVSLRSDPEMASGIAAATALIKDGHTFVDPGGVNQLNVKFERFPEGIFVVATGADVTRLLGLRVTSIGKVAIDDLRRRVTALIPAENEFTAAAREARMLERVSVLVAAGAAEESSGIEVAGVDRDGRPVQAIVGKVTTGPIGVQVPSALPLSMQNRSLNYWYLSSGSTVYFQYNACQARADLPMAKVAADLKAQFESGGPWKLIVDLRFNEGGDSAVINPLFDMMSGLLSSGKAPKVALLLGNRTYSSALMNAVTMAKFPGVTTYGETPGGSIDVSFGEVKGLVLPYSQAKFFYSTTRFILDASRRVMTPNRTVAWPWSDYESGKDPVLSAALTDD